MEGSALRATLSATWLAAAVALAAVVFNVKNVHAQWKPGKNVELIVPFAAGGGNDLPARIIQKIVTGERMLPVSMTVVNKPGAGGVVGVNYLNQHREDGHFLAIISTSMLTNHAIGVGAVNYTDVTPILLLISEYIVFAVNPASKLRTFRDLVERMKAEPASLSFAVGGGLGNPNHVAIAAALKGAGADVRRMKAVAFGGGKEAMTSVMGGHVDVLAAAGSVLDEQVKAGKLRAIAAASPARLGGALKDVPTLKEQGVNAVFAFSRYIVGPKGLSNDEIAYWEGVFARVLKTRQWKAELEQNNWDGSFLTSAQTIKDLETQYAALHSVLVDIGLAK